MRQLVKSASMFFPCSPSQRHITVPIFCVPFGALTNSLACPFPPSRAQNRTRACLHATRGRRREGPGLRLESPRGPRLCRSRAEPTRFPPVNSPGGDSREVEGADEGRSERMIRFLLLQNQARPARRNTTFRWTMTRSTSSIRVHRLVVNRDRVHKLCRVSQPQDHLSASPGCSSRSAST